MLNRFDVLSTFLLQKKSFFGLCGIEKEGLRVTKDGVIASTSHPHIFGSALTHPSLTTDYSEAMIELITPTEVDPAISIKHLDMLHRYVYRSIGDEMLWANSMPCILPDEDKIKIAEYGNSNIGRLKTIYRRGLANRYYGRKMQCIAGIHYNFSIKEEIWHSFLKKEKSNITTLIEYRSNGYLDLIRNFHRTSWLLVYLFGATPVVDVRFLLGRTHNLDMLDENTLYGPYTTCLRMSHLGYSCSTKQTMLQPDYNTIFGYIKTLSKFVSEPYPDYKAIGTHHNGEWIQINTNILQIENELYSKIRPKCTPYRYERQLHAIETRGVEYIEVRCLDIDPFEPNGIRLDTTRFLDAYLLFCMLESSPKIDSDAYHEANINFERVTMEGRKPGLMLSRSGHSIPFVEWATELLEKIRLVGRFLDEIYGNHEHMAAITLQEEKLDNPERTPSACVLRKLIENSQSFIQFGIIQSKAYANHFREQPLPDDYIRSAKAIAEHSLKQQLKIEENENEQFDVFMRKYSSYKGD
ncbi:MAG: glutamate--cysteine ligase [Burkholderia sp.]|nr:glutamate--cysteine ligase [Burkholderia sp.]